MATIKDLVPTVTYLKLSNVLRLSFPDARVAVSDDHVDALILHIWNHCDDETCFAIFGAPKPDPTQIDEFNKSIMVTCTMDGHSYYLAHATHTRVSGPGKHSFTGHLPLVRVTLADTDQNAKVISTSIGDVDPADHLFQSIEQVAFKLKDDLVQAPAKVDLITPARSMGTRFGAIAVYIGYFDPKGAPSFYILEAGTATGESMVYFLSPDMGTIPATEKWYDPTPFTGPDGYYSGDFIMQGDDPSELHVRAMDKNKVLQVTVNVQYTPSLPEYIFPAILTAEAAARVGAIAVARGDIVFEDILAPLGRLLTWISPPK